MIGSTISHYKILEKLGGGGMGVVYKAEDTKLKRNVALKFLPPELTRDSDSKQRFIQEAQAASALQHNNICTVHDIDETGDGQMFMVMDLYDGETLKKKIERGRLEPDIAANIASQIAEGLARAHGKGIVHRDIKPANVLLTTDGVVKIVDFGLAKFLGSPQITKEGRRPGTTLYMSPEQLRGEELDARTDIWSFGVLLYQLLTGTHPFAAEFDQAVMYRIISEEPPPVSSLQPDVPNVLSELVTQCLQKERSHRPQSMDEVLKTLSGSAGASVRVLNRRLVSRILAVLALGIVLASVGVYVAWDLLFRPPPQSIGVAVLQFTDETRDTSFRAYKPEIQRLFEHEFVNVNRIIVRQRAVLNANIKSSFGEENPGRNDKFLKFLREQTLDYVIDGSITTSSSGGTIIQASVVKAMSYEPVNVFQGTLSSRWQLDSVCECLARQACAFVRLEILEDKPNLGVWSKRKPRDYRALERLYKAYEFYCAGDRQSTQLANAALQDAVALDSAFISPRIWISSYYRRADPEAARRNQAVLMMLRPGADKFEQAMIDWAGAFINYDPIDEVRSLKKALEFEPANRVLLANLAGAYVEKHDTLHALQAYRYCVTSKWEHKPVYRAAVPLQMGFRWYDSAKVALHNWTQVDTSAFSYFPQMYGWLHALHLRSGEILEAKKWKDKFDIACADSAVGAIAFTLGACYADAGLMSRGDSLMRLAISLDNNNPGYHEKYGSSLLQYGDIEHALPQLTLAARLTTPSKGLMLKLGNIFKLKGDTSKALEYYNRFLVRDSISYDSKQVHTWLAEIGRAP